MQIEVVDWATGAAVKVSMRRGKRAKRYARLGVPLWRESPQCSHSFFIFLKHIYKGSSLCSSWAEGPFLSWLWFYSWYWLPIFKERFIWTNTISMLYLHHSLNRQPATYWHVCYNKTGSTIIFSILQMKELRQRKIKEICLNSHVK